ncbi:hypothetical protein FD755_006700, partial [Muntiacus reevesi]
MVLTAVLGTGLIYQHRDEDDDLEEHDAFFVQEHFTVKDCLIFSISSKRTEVNYASILVWNPVPLQQGVRKNQGSCVPPPPIPLLFAWKRNKGLNLKTITFPVYSQAGQNFYLANILGGTALGESMGLSPKAMRLQYHLKPGEGKENEGSKAWMIHFLRKVGSLEKSLALKKFKVVYFSSLSRQLEFEATSMTMIPLFHLAYLLIILFAIVSCYRCGCIQNKMWVTAFGVISAALAVVSSFGLMLYIGVPFMIIVANSPFLILAGYIVIFTKTKQCRKEPLSFSPWEPQTLFPSGGLWTPSSFSSSDILSTYLGINS